MRLKTSQLAVTGVAVLALLMGACGGSKGGDTKTAASGTCVKGDTVTLGFLNSTSGVMSISEQTVRDSLVLAAGEINAAGGILGKQIKYIVGDGAGEPSKIAEKIGKLLTRDKVAAAFGGGDA